MDRMAVWAQPRGSRWRDRVVGGRGRDAVGRESVGDLLEAVSRAEHGEDPVDGGRVDGVGLEAVKALAEGALLGVGELAGVYRRYP